MTRVQPVLVVHGGAGHSTRRSELTRRRRSLRAICESAADYLADHSAVESVVRAVAQLEDDPLFNAGTGSSVQRDGRVRMSAAIMDGRHRRFAAVLNIERVRHPILIAQALLERSDRVLAGTQATRFARSLGFPSWNPVTTIRLAQWRRQRASEGHGTVGAVALDRQGHLAAATSTGGKGFELPGRVSDSGLPIGNYADPNVAISCTGIGEDIIDEGLAVRIAQRVADGDSLSRAFRRTFRELAARHRRAGAIGLDRRGRVTWDTTLPVLLAMRRTVTRQLEPH